MKFEDAPSGVRLRLEQSNIPAGEAERTQQAWRENVFERIKRLFGYGTFGSPF
jgi:activator of HSP90 ATPase